MLLRVPRAPERSPPFASQLSELLAENASLRERLLLRSSTSHAPCSAASDRYTPQSSATNTSWRLSNEEVGTALGITHGDGAALRMLNEQPQSHSQSEGGRGRWNSMYGIDANGQAPGLSYPGSPAAIRLHAGRHTIT